MQKSQLPPHLVWGKGTPGILPEELAIAAILKVFASRGLKTNTNVPYGENGVVVNLDGLVAQSPRQVGFELVSSDFTNGEDFQWPDAWTTDPTTGKQIPSYSNDDPTSLSELEMAKLDQDSASGERVIALINQLFVYATPELPTDIWQQLGVTNENQEEALQALAASVHEFLDFAEQQGAL